MFKSLMILLVMAGMALAVCGPSMAPNYAQECLPGIRWDQPGRVVDGLGGEQPATVSAGVVERQPLVSMLFDWARWLGLRGRWMPDAAR